MVRNIGEEAEALRVPPLRSGGVMLTYQCNQECRHCSYRCRPGADEWMSDSMLDLVLDTLAGERRLVDVHLAGGEATLRPDFLESAVRKAVEKKIRLSYLETNGWFAETVDKAKKTLAPLKKAGLISVLVSISPYHNEAIPLSHTLNCLEAAADVFGRDGVFPWLSHFIPMLAKMDPELPHPLEEFMDVNGIDPDDGSMLRLFPLTPGGRVPEKLRRFFRLRRAEEFRVGHCLDMLTGVDHFHIDPDGNLFTGHCPGIIAGLAPDLHHEKTADQDPLFAAAALGGPYALMELAKKLYAFRENPEGYVSPCDLCYQARRCMVENEPERWAELGPLTFYSD